MLGVLAVLAVAGGVFVYDRFFRVAGAPPGGSGLGLAIAQTAALRNGLRIELSNRKDGPGLLARVFLPRSS